MSAKLNPEDAFNIALLDSVDADCIAHGLPPLSWIIADVPGRPNATKDQRDQVHAAAAKGMYEILSLKNGTIQ